VIFLGPPGVGKTHLAISLAIAAAQHGRRVYYGTLADLIGSREEAKAAGRLTQRLKTLTHPAVLVVDEIGYLPITQTGAMLFFQLMSRRYEHGSTVLTPNKSFEEWGEVFGDEVMAAALIDRLVHPLPYRPHSRQQLSYATAPRALAESARRSTGASVA
jgi:DNA replication protein DnaC